MTPDVWVDRVIERHTQSMTRPEFLKAVRALSARYVEQRAGLRDRSPLDSAGKRAAFAGFYAPLHFLTVRQIAESVGLGRAEVETIMDLGCGTGICGAAWALACETPPRIVGVDLNTWALDETRWNLASLGLRARTKRGHLVAALEQLAARPAPRSGVILGWSLNEISEPDRARAVDLIITLSTRATPVAVIEPIATRIVPWWPRFASRVEDAGGRVDEWKFDAPRPSALANLDEAAGFHRESLSARSAVFGVS